MFRLLPIAIATFAAFVSLQAAPMVPVKSKVWRFSRVAMADTEATTGSQVVLNSIEITGDRMLVRLGVQGVLGRAGPFTTPTLIEESVTLKIASSARKLPCISLERKWEPGKPLNLFRGEMLGATLLFHAPRGIEEQPMFLRVNGYGHISFRCSDGSPIIPPDVSQTPERWDIDESVDGSMPGYERLRLTLGAMRVWEGRLTFGLTFTNAARFPFRMTGAPPGAAATLVSGEREFFREPVVVGAIEKSIAPSDDWRPEEPVTGTVTFPLPHRHGLNRMWFAFPGFPDLPLVFDESLKRWRVEKENMQRRGVPIVQLWTRAEQQLFESVTGFWQTISKQLSSREFAGAFAAFDSPQDVPLLRGIEKAPLAFLEVLPDSAQQVAMQGSDISLRMTMRYRFRGQPETDQFMLTGICKMRRVAESWRVIGLTLALAPPWAQGYTAFGESKHFLIFYRPEGSQAEQAMAVLEQLEDSWQTSATAGLKLAPRYAAFLCLQPEDHKLLTGDLSINTALASVGGTAMDEQDVFKTYNTAIYVSPNLFSRSSPLQRRRMMQTALNHEMVHAALSPATRAWMPGWLIEGTAVHLSAERRDDPRVLADAFSGGLTLRTLSETGALRDPGGDLMKVDQQYALSAAAVAVITERWGVSKLLQLYHAFSIEYPEAWRGPYGVDYSDETSAKKREARLDLTRRLLKRVLVTTIEEIERSIRRETNARLGGR